VKKLSDLSKYVKRLIVPAQLPTLFNFSHEYHKLRDPEFTTIRSIKYNTAPKRNFSWNAIGWVSVNRRRRKIIKVKNFKDEEIGDIPLNVLKKDVEYPGFTIETHQDFVDGLNRILLEAGYKYANTQITTVKRIFYLKELKEGLLSTNPL